MAGFFYVRLRIVTCQAISHSTLWSKSNCQNWTDTKIKEAEAGVGWRSVCVCTVWICVHVRLGVYECGCGCEGIEWEQWYYTCACYVNHINLILFTKMCGKHISVSNTLFNHSCGINLACTLLLSLKLDLLGMQIFVFVLILFMCGTPALL